MSASFSYDALGRRISKTVNGVTTTFHYDGLDITRENSGAGEASYLRTLAIDEALSRTDGTGTLSYLADIVGSTIALTRSTGVTSSTYTYAPYGESSVADLSRNPFQFTGRENDGTGLYYCRARYYDPTRGRFAAQDPIGLMGGDTNFYIYANQNPLRWLDPFGLIEWPLDAPMPWNEGAENLPGSPTYGNWGGKNYSGGRVGEVGPFPPIDSMDECFKEHDLCYGDRGCWKHDASARRECDRKLLDCLAKLDKDPRKWKRPGPDPSEALSYRVKATIFFSIWSRL